MYSKSKIAEILNIDRKTINNWKTTRPKLYEIVMNYFNIEEKQEKCDICEYYNELSKEEKEMYLAEIKAKVLRKKLNEKG